MDQVSHGVVITDPNQDDNPTIYTNKNFLETFQLEAKDILGKNCRILQHHNTNQKNKVKLKEAIRNKEQITVELLNYKKDLTPIKIELSINPIFDKKTDNLKYFLGIQKPI